VSPATWLRSLVPDALRRQLFVLETWQWLGLLVVIMAGVVAGRVTVAVSRGAIDGFMRRRLVALNLDLLASAMRPGGVLVMVAIWGLGILWLGLPVAAMRLYMDAVKVVAIIAAVVTAYMLVNVLVDVVAQRAARTESGFDDLLVPLIGKSLKVFVVAVGLLLIAGNLRVDVTGLVAGLGLGGLAFALAAKDTVSNLFGSLTVLLDRPFQVGDWVVVGDVEGTVEGLGFRSTRIRTFYNSLITLPNTNLISASVDNLGARAYRRWKTRIGVTYDTPPEAVDAFCEGVRELIREHPYTRKDYFHVYLNDFGDSAVEILLYMFFMTPDWATELRERHRLGVDIMRLAAELGVEFAFPTRTLYMRAQEWAAPEAAGERYPEAVARLESDARETARDLARGTLGGEVPPPVSFPISEQENRGEADE
jgi:MscS family membrane protein